MKILLLASQHGNELLGDALYAHLQDHYSHLLPSITFKIGNPKAYEEGVRYIESDMNRSYDSSLSTYEANLAKAMEEYIKKEKFDLVLDLHTTICDQPPCIIVGGIYPENRSFLQASSIDKIVCIQDDIIHTTLVGKCPQAIAIEVSNDDITTELLDTMSRDIETYINDTQVPNEKTIYTVESLLLKSDVPVEEASQLINFKMMPSGYIPILTGENSYKKNTHYLGFKATKAVKSTV